MTASAMQPALFPASDIGLDVPDWDAALAPAGRCAHCRRPLRSSASRAAGVGPGCAAATGREVVATRRLRRAAAVRSALAA
ncbi:DUF6011 domain-containing protein [Streptomyces virginiae]|uniref:DUF6011 domain-containing protein n=1 Tax=Streptomyces virginiae TaxID=1961 RepID=UPI003433CBB5